MPSSQDSYTQPKRPSMLARQSSTSSALSQSPSDGAPSHRSGHHKQHKHVVGHGRLGSRNPSFGKNLNKLNKLTQAHANDNTSNAKHHRRTLSGNSTPSSSPRPGVKRNASSMGIIRTTPSAQIRKNHSSGHLSRQGSSKTMLKATKSDVAQPKRSLMKSAKARNASPPDHPSVRFDIGDDDNHEDAWTEESASQSPTTTRSNTRQNSIIIDPEPTPQAEDQLEAQSANLGEGTRSQMHTPPRLHSHAMSDPDLAAQQINGASSYKASIKPPDADMITSRLLRRTGSHHVPPQMSSVSATVVTDAQEPRSLSQSQGSTLADTPGKDLVSRFMGEAGSSGTLRDSSFVTPRATSNDQQHGQQPSPQSSGLDPAKRNKSVPNIASESSLLHSRAPSRRSGTTTPTDLNPSRTQQKLWLQRASSNIEPQKMIPVILPRSGGPQLLGASANYAATNEGRTDPRLQRQFDQVALEYKVVRRYRNPLTDAFARIERLPSTVRKAHAPKSPKKNGFFTGGSNIRHSPTASRSGGVAADGTSTPRDGYDDSDGEDGRHSFESEGRRVFRTEAEEICRRLWESTEVPERAD